MKIQRSINTVRNTIWGILNKIVSLFFPFIIRTIIIKQLGSEYLGLSSLFTSILTVLNLAELGVSNAIVFSMYKPIAEDDKDTICALMNLYKKLYRAIGCFILIVGLALTPFLPKLINGSYPEAINIYILYFLYLANTVIGYFLFAYKNCLLTAHQRLDVSTKISIFIAIVQYILQIIVLVVFHNYYLYVAIMTLCQVSNNLLVAYRVDRLYPEYHAFGQLDKNVMKDNTTRVSGLMLSKIATVTRNTFDSIFLSMFLGLTVVSIYSNYYYFLNAIISILAIITTSMSAGIGNSIAIETKEKNYHDMNKFIFMFSWISGFCAICLACLYQPTMKLWVGEELMFPNYIAIIFAIYFYALTMNSIKDRYYDACGLWWKGKGRTVAEMVANIVLNYILGKTLGVVGILAATIITAIIINFGYGTQILYKYYFTEYKIRDFYLSHLFYLTVTVIVGCITYGLCGMIDDGGVLTLLLKLVICIFAPNILYLLVYHRNKFFNDTIVMVRSLLHLKNK